MAESTTIGKVRQALRITTTAFDTEIGELIDAALVDLGIAGANGDYVEELDPLTLQAIKTYVKMNFGEPDDFDRLKKSYDEQKAQMGMASGYTKWGTSWTDQTC